MKRRIVLIFLSFPLYTVLYYNIIFQEKASLPGKASRPAHQPFSEQIPFNGKKRVNLSSTLLLQAARHESLSLTESNDNGTS